MRATRGRSFRVQPMDRSVLEVPDGLPIDPVRTTLYSPAELYGDGPYAASTDATAYAWAKEPASGPDSLAQALHDHAVDEALATWADDRPMVGVMGGHAVDRGDPAYLAAARFTHEVGSDLVVATGGGPGCMEAANLGAYLSTSEPEALDDAVRRLADVPSFRPSVDAWVDAARSVLADHPSGTDSLGIPTWFDGHEPSNLFATSIAKYFRNALRESILLEICQAGIVFLPGYAGTLQEIFQDACENYYADDDVVAPMVLVDREHWTETLPAWPLLETLARGRAMEEHIHLVDSVEDAAALVLTSSSHRLTTSPETASREQASP